jgi:hypothetical protein
MAALAAEGEDPWRGTGPMTRVLFVIAALVAAFLAGATAQANWPVRAAWEDNL